MTSNEKANRLKDALRQTRYAIIGRGGEISETAGLKDLRGTIFNIPADNAITTVISEDEALGFKVPENTTGYAYLAEFGGFSRPLDDGFSTEALAGLACWTDDWGEVDSLVVPEEIRNLPDYGDGINLEYYNKVDLVNQKYKRCIETIVLDEKLTWRNGTVEGAYSNYYVSKIGELGVFVSYNCVSSYFDHAPISSATTGAGIDVFDSSAFGGFVVAIRPENVQDFTLSSFIEWIKANPITVKVARAVPIETDLPVYMNPIFKVAPSSIGIDLFPSDGTGIPAKIIFQTYTQ